MNVQTLRSWEHIDELAQEWNSLLERSAAPSIFQTWEWINAWRLTGGKAAEPYVICVRDSNGSLVGLAPMYLGSMRLRGLFDFRVLRFLADTDSGAEYPDWIVDTRYESQVADRIALELRQNSGEWSAIWLQWVATWSGAGKRIVEPAIGNGLSVRSRERLFSVIPLPDEISAFDQRFSSKWRQKMRRTARRLKADGLTCLECTDATELPAFLDALMDLHQQRWMSVGRDGVFVRKPAEAEFYRRFAPIALDKGWLAIYALIRDGEIKSVQFGYRYAGAFLQMQEGYDPDDPSVGGNGLRHQVIEDCIHNGITEYDFLGGTSEHKRRWRAEVRTGQDVFIFSRSWKARVLHLAGVWPTGRFIEQVGLSVE
ncbi:MAG: GNAT family N-acetyltransferase [Gammaproteobacteria bacterium]|nr:GNAT family N-acetyltransferase [Gammaproteobacteria bacterium]